MIPEAKSKEDILEHTIMKNIRRKARYIDQLQVIDGVPLFSWIDINPTELCNRKCVFCPRVDPKVYPNQNLHMKIETAEKMAAELRGFNYKGGVIFSGFGEPILHQNFPKLVAAFGKDIHTELVTNGDRLNPKVLEELYGAGLDVILVSMYDGPHQIEKFTKLFKEAGISDDHYVLRDRWYDLEKDFGLKLTNRAGKVQSGHQEAVDTHKACYYTHYSMMIDWNGDVLVCVQDWNKDVKFGNVEKESLWDIWNKKEFKEYRKHLANGERSLSPCNGCNVNGTLHGTKHVEMWKGLLK